MYGNNLTNYGTISSNGSQGGDTWGSNGGGSGGGSINIFTRNIVTTIGTIQANGGKTSVYSWLTAGNGTATRTQISQKTTTNSIDIYNTYKNSLLFEIRYNYGTGGVLKEILLPILQKYGTVLYDGSSNIIGVKTKYGNIMLSDIGVTITEQMKLASAVKVGDFVNYDAGTWTTTAALPTTSGTFGGYTAGTSKNMCITPYNRYDNTYSGGWRVLSKSGDVVNLVHAGTPAAYYTKTTIDQVDYLETFCQNNFLNGNYAQSARSIDISEINDTIKITGSYYYCVYTSWRYIRVIGISGGQVSTLGCRGVRPVVTLKSGIITTGKSSNGYGQQGWNLVAMP